MSTSVWRQFKGVLPSGALTVARVVSVEGDGRTSIVEFPGGSQARVSGQSVSADNYAFVRDGAITGPAPTITPATLDV